MHAVSFYFKVYNFVKTPKTIKTTPAMEAGVTTYLWSMEDIDDDGDDGAIKKPAEAGFLLSHKTYSLLPINDISKLNKCVNILCRLI